MKQMVRLALVLISCASVHTVLAEVLPFYGPIRSISSNTALELVGWHNQINQMNDGEFYSSLSITPGLQQTFRDRNIAHDLFCDVLYNFDCCDDECSTFLVQGTKVVNRQSKALLAENFGLPTDFQSTVQVCPRIRSFFVDFNLYLGLDNWAEGLYFRIHAPAVRTWWDLRLDESVNQEGIQNYDPGYFNGVFLGAIPNQYGVARANLLHNFREFVSEGKVPTFPAAGSFVTKLDTVKIEPLKYARMGSCVLKDSRLSDLQFALGWNFWQGENYHFGLLVRAAAPTGTLPNAHYLFEPLVGNGHHWECGGGLTSHWTMWRSDDEEKSFGAYLDANVTHLFKSRQCRTFDLCGKPLSRYMLAAKFGTPVVDLNDVADNVPSGQFKSLYTSVANLTTFPVNVEIGVQGDLTLLFNYTRGNLGIDFGYNFYGRSKEKICKCDNGCSEFAENTWVLKGDAFMFGFVVNPETLLPTSAVALSASQSTATVTSGTNGWPSGIGAVPWQSNPGIDAPQPAFAGLSPLQSVLGSDATGELVQSSFDPVYIKESDIEFAGTKLISHKAFWHIGYTWNDMDVWTPFFGIGGEFEFSHKDKCCCPSTCTNNSDCCSTSCCSTDCSSSCSSSCCDDNCCDKKCCKGRYMGLWQWGLWFKGGVSFH